MKKLYVIIGFLVGVNIFTFGYYYRENKNINKSRSDDGLTVQEVNLGWRESLLIINSISFVLITWKIHNIKDIVISQENRAKCINDGVGK